MACRGLLFGPFRPHPLAGARAQKGTEKSVCAVFAIAFCRIYPAAVFFFANGSRELQAAHRPELRRRAQKAAVCRGRPAAGTLGRHGHHP